MTVSHSALGLILTGLLLLGFPFMASAATGDADASGYVGLADYRSFEECFSASGSGGEIPPGCLGWFDFDNDGDIDLVDFAFFQGALGHLPIPLKDSIGAPIPVASTTPYDGRQTCGGVGCHDDIDDIANGLKFQQGRTDIAGGVVMQDDYFADGRWWVRGPGRYGIWAQDKNLQLAGKDNASESVFDQSAFAWIRDCGACHTGGGPGEFDRDGNLLYAYYDDTEEWQFGYERRGLGAGDVLLNGDYADLDFATGSMSPARWDLTGLAGPDCLFCHRAERPLTTGPSGDVDLIKHWREATLGAGMDLVDDGGQPVPAFAAAATAGQGWFSNIEIIQDGYVARATTLQIDYSVGLADGSLLTCPGDTLCLNPAAMAARPPDRACWACHNQDDSVHGMVWFDESVDVHYRFFTNRHDEDPGNDIPADKSKACLECHPGGPAHNFAKGGDFQFHTRDDQDWIGFRSCRECHLDTSTNPHPDAPVVPTYEPDDIHIFPMFDTMSCQSCHMPYATRPAVVFYDSTAGGIVWPEIGYAGMTSEYYSANPFNPADLDKSRWYPAFEWKLDSDHLPRLFPYNRWVNIHWADWDQNGTPEDKSDDLLTPIIGWRMYQVISSATLAALEDDDGDGRPEVNTPAEILAFITDLKGTDSYGRQVAANPVLVKGFLVWYEDPDNPGVVTSLVHKGTGIPVEAYSFRWGTDHNVLPLEESWGYGTSPDGCDHCHIGPGLGPVFDRPILIDPYNPDGQPVYLDLGLMVGVDPWY